MPLEKLVIIIHPYELERLNNLLTLLISKHPRLAEAKSFFGKVGTKIIVNYEVESDLYETMVNELSDNNFRIVATNHKTKQMLAAKFGHPYQAIEDFPDTPEQKPPAVKVKEESKDEELTIEQLIEQGDYKKVIAASKNISLDKHIIETAKGNIDTSIQNAVNKFYNKAIAASAERKNSILNLIEIAGDRNLKLIHKENLMSRAGLLVIELCNKFVDNLDLLINLINNSNVLPMVTIKAAVLFWQKVFDSPELFRDDLIIAYKNLNTRLLQIQLDYFEKEITSTEKLSVTALISYIKQHR